MNLKTYTAESMTEALSEVKKDLGRDAVILHTRVYKAGGVLGVGSRQVVEITASDSVSARGPRIRDAAPGPTPLARPAKEPAGRFTPSAFPDARPAQAAPPAPQAESPPPTPRSASVRESKPLATRVDVAPQDAAAIASLRTELASIKQLVGQVIDLARTGSAGPAQTEPILDLSAQLSAAGVAHAISDRLIAGIRASLTAPELADPGIVRATALRAISALIPVVGAFTPAQRQPDGRPLAIALVGPTGVGKTTTIAKLAATYKLRQGRKIGLVTSDTYRIAAVEQLRTYADIIGLPLKVAMTPAEMAAALDSLSDCDAVLIDTAGRSQHDSRRLDELAEFLAAAAPHETHLVLSAAAADSVISRAARRFAALKPSRLILSKLDESVHSGVALNVAQRAGLPLSFVTLGQEVPDHIELADSDRLARRILDPVEGEDLNA